MGNLGEDLVTKLRRVLQQHEVKLEPAASFYTEQQWSPDSNDPTLSYLSRMLMDEDDEVESLPPQRSYQGLLDELTAIVSPSSSSRESSRESDSPGSPSDAGFVSGVIDESPNSPTVDIQWCLMECARAVAAKDFAAFYALASDLRQVVSSQSTPLERLAMFFIEALVARVTGTGPQTYRALAAGMTTRRILSGSRIACLPSSRIHTFANDVILRACAGARRVHIVDYGLFCGQQWPSLIKALSVRPEGPPHLKITGIDLPMVPEVTQAGQHLTEYARSHGVQLEFCSIQSNSWETVQPVTHSNEFLVVNSNGRLQNMKDEWVAINNPRKLLLERISKMSPKLVVMTVGNSSMSSPFFLPKFEAALEYYTAKMEYTDAWLSDDLEQRSLMEKTFQKVIMNVVACDGLDQVERPEKYKTWDVRAKRAGFKPFPVEDEDYERMKTTWGGYKYSEHFRCGRDENWVLLGWKDVIMCAMSAWQTKARF
ncbi:GRAS-family protein [Selaginella moellendorffii]|uniref:GRAS-family protein n=1 Tax=Selaginella moellendorffii TaxID=88036 RepID=D8QYZ5_SELML|nr:scarecrow-like protein 14 [Selaginella moellendorffii]EFJ34329.1 GRAS-family protein [Selaginella moellendorffii]|eukprot:XP_002963996.1 scarecrow-like protein 14 [Selaginella moellendorffii]